MSLRDRLETLHLMSPTSGWPIGPTVLVPGVAHMRIAVYSAILGSNANAQAYFATDAGATPIGGDFFALSGMSTVLPQNDNTDPWFITPTGKDLSIAVVAGPVYGDIYYMVVPGTLVPGVTD